MAIIIFLYLHSSHQSQWNSNVTIYGEVVASGEYETAVCNQMLTSNSHVTDKMKCWIEVPYCEV